MTGLIWELFVIQDRDWKQSSDRRSKLVPLVLEVITRCQLVKSQQLVIIGDSMVAQQTTMTIQGVPKIGLPEIIQIRLS